MMIWIKEKNKTTLIIYSIIIKSTTRIGDNRNLKGNWSSRERGSSVRRLFIQVSHKMIKGLGLVLPMYRRFPAWIQWAPRGWSWLIAIHLMNRITKRPQVFRIVVCRLIAEIHSLASQHRSKIRRKMQPTWMQAIWSLRASRAKKLRNSSLNSRMMHLIRTLSRRLILRIRMIINLGKRETCVQRKINTNLNRKTRKISV